ncbi:MAG: DUF255 domain-containing protein [Saprospiraceae bacterium]|jgi:thioredoxin-related protein|nr:DUF255 domain-containing protein [Saprospiraceae bacterium]
MKVWGIAGVLLLSTIVPLSGQTKAEPEAIQWLNWDQATSKSKEDKRKVLLNIYTSWCRWCDRMDEVTFSDPKVAKYINDKYHAVKFDAEYKEDISFNGKVYKYVKNGKTGYHEFAAELLNNRLSFPAVVILDEELQTIQTIMGFKPPQSFECIISYFGSNQYKLTPWSAYERNCMPQTQPARSEKQALQAQPKQSPQLRLIKN